MDVTMCRKCPYRLHSFPPGLALIGEKHLCLDCPEDNDRLQTTATYGRNDQPYAARKARRIERERQERFALEQRLFGMQS
jgi:hypothetical protein